MIQNLHEAGAWHQIIFDQQDAHGIAELPAAQDRG
jgi:hypothetical protein